MAKSRPKPPASKRLPPRPRRSAGEVARHADRILQLLDRQTEENAEKGITTAVISREELIRKLSGKTAHSPFMASIGRSNAVRGGTFGLWFTIMQPDPWSYDDNNLALCYCWSDAGGLTDPGSTLLRAEPSVGVIQVPLGILNGAAMPYTIPSSHNIPTGFRAGPAELSYFLYTPDAFAASVLLERGTLRVVVA
jgi:hypothetical protein